MKTILLAITLIALAGCSDSTTATRVLSDNGFSDIQITGYRWTGCSDRDTYKTGFTASSPAGKTVGGVVCSGWGWFGKSATIRFD